MFSSEIHVLPDYFVKCLPDADNWTYYLGHKLCVHVHYWFGDLHVYMLIFEGDDSTSVWLAMTIVIMQGCH